jgi:hypothetical protein
MGDSRIGKLMMAMGGTLGVGAGLALILGLKPSRLPPALLDIAAYKLIFISVAVLMAAGAAIRRYARQTTSTHEGSYPAERPLPALDEGQAQPLNIRERARDAEQLHTPR